LSVHLGQRNGDERVHLVPLSAIPTSPSGSERGSRAGLAATSGGVTRTPPADRYFPRACR
jgi:hypothetical protein